MHEPSKMLIALNIKTRAHHAEVDAVWLDLLATVTATKYLQTLVKVYGFEAPVEAAFAYTPRIESLREVHRPRSGLIAQDLLALGLVPSQLTQLSHCDEVTSFRDLPEALGWLYVVERSALLHPKVHARLALQLPEAERGFAYLQHDDGFIGRRWAAFGRLLDENARTEQTAAEIVRAANTAFDCQRRWLGPRRVARAASSLHS